VAKKVVLSWVSSFIITKIELLPEDDINNNDRLYQEPLARCARVVEDVLAKSNLLCEQIWLDYEESMQTGIVILLDAIRNDLNQVLPCLTSLLGCSKDKCLF
jgi:hypothetical protein